MKMLQNASDLNPNRFYNFLALKNNVKDSVYRFKISIPYLLEKFVISDILETRIYEAVQELSTSLIVYQFFCKLQISKFMR